MAAKRIGWPPDRCHYTAFVGDNRPSGAVELPMRNLAIVEKHVAAEETNDIEVLMGTIAKEPRYALGSTLEESPSFSVTTTHDGVRDYYVHSREFVHEIVRSLHLQQITTDWYVFYESTATTRQVQRTAGGRQLGEETTGNSIAFFPAAPDGIIGEMPLSRYRQQDILQGTAPIRQLTHHLPVKEQRNTQVHDSFLEAVQEANVSEVLRPLDDNCLWVGRNYFGGGGPMVAAVGKAEVSKNLEAMFDAVDVLGITVLNRIVKDWYIFADLVLTLRSRGRNPLFGPGGTELQARTAAMHPMAEDGRIMGSMGYGTDVTQGER